MTGFFQELFHTGLYKRTQGRITRQVTFAALAVTVVLGAWRLSQALINLGPAWSLGIMLLLVAAGVWAAYRVVNVPNFADFLIAVEAEMNKVSWPTRHELFRASIVVLVVIFFMAFILAVFDVVWVYVFRGLGIV